MPTLSLACRLVAGSYAEPTAGRGPRERRGPDTRERRACGSVRLAEVAEVLEDRGDATRRERVGARLRAWRAARKVAISTVGFTVLAIGILLLVLPGPGMLVVLLGLGILSTEYHWPKRLARYLRERAQRLADEARQRREARRSRRAAAKGRPGR
jgi:uncharacterized protein (TIGR02611 family)